MSQNTRISSKSMEYARRQVNSRVAPAVIDSIAMLKDKIDDAEERVADEGIVVRDMKGSVIAHPAIKISEDAMKAMLNIIERVTKGVL